MEIYKDIKGTKLLWGKWQLAMDLFHRWQISYVGPLYFVFICYMLYVIMNIIYLFIDFNSMTWCWSVTHNLVLSIIYVFVCCSGQKCVYVHSGFSNETWHMALLVISSIPSMTLIMFKVQTVPMSFWNIYFLTRNVFINTN